MNRKLKSGELARASPTSRRKTAPRLGMWNKFKTAATTATFALALACGTASVVKPTTARAEPTKVTKANVESLTVVKLTKPLKDLDRESEKYSEGEFYPDGDKKYCNTSIVPGEVKFMITLSKDGTTKRLTVQFPEERETDPEATEPGLRGTDLHDFAELVKRTTGQNLERVKIIVDAGTYEANGKEINYANAYILPIDSNGNAITSIGNGKYLAYGSTYHGSTVYVAPAVIVEPNNQTTLALARR